jgi:hypothetical protein
MNCPSCQKEIPDGSAFCLNCGKSTKPKGKWSLPVLMLAIGLVVGGIVVAIVIISNNNRSAQTDSDSSQSVAPVTSPRQPTQIFIPHTDKLVSGQLIVKAGSAIQYKLEIDTSKMINPVVSGEFRASGGTGNDIAVVLADEDNFENWINGHPANVLYSTPKTTNGRLSIPIAQSGTYYLAFSNRFSLLTSKQVFAEIQLTYATRQNVP